MGIGRVAAGASLWLLLTRIVGGDSGSCDTSALLDLRGEWASKDEPCHGKLSFDLWLLMKAQGSHPSAVAQGVLDHCVALDDLQLLELKITEGSDFQTSKGYRGAVVNKCACSATLSGASATDLEALCEDDGISRAARVSPIHGRHYLGSPEHLALRKRRYERRLQATTSEAVAAHEVDVLTAGLEELGCANTKGDGQIICAMSDSFNASGYVHLLQEQGDLPRVKVIKDNPDGTDEGSAMIELAYDIAPNAEYKFHTTSFGEEAFTDAILYMADTEGCDIMVDDISYPQECVRAGRRYGGLILLLSRVWWSTKLRVRELPQHSFGGTLWMKRCPFGSHDDTSLRKMPRTSSTMVILDCSCQGHVPYQPVTRSSGRLSSHVSDLIGEGTRSGAR